MHRLIGDQCLDILIKNLRFAISKFFETQKGGIDILIALHRDTQLLQPLFECRSA